ncbi:hypothetical protein [Paenibacillus lactis]
MEQITRHLNGDAGQGQAQQKVRDTLLLALDSEIFPAAFAA